MLQPSNPTVKEWKCAVVVVATGAVSEEFENVLDGPPFEIHHLP